MFGVFVLILVEVVSVFVVVVDVVVVKCVVTACFFCFPLPPRIILSSLALFLGKGRK